MRVRFSDGTANVEKMIKELQYLEKYLNTFIAKSNHTCHIKSADLYIRIYDENEEQIEFADKEHSIKSIEFREKPYKTKKGVVLKEQIDIFEDKTIYMYETNKGYCGNQQK